MNIKYNNVRLFNLLNHLLNMTSSQFDDALREILPSLRGFSRRFALDHDECGDLVQDTMLKALTYRHKYQQDVNFKGWLYTIMRNVFINQYHKKRRARDSQHTEGNRRLASIADENTLNKPAALLEVKEILSQVEILRGDLKTPLQMCMTGYKYHEIAEALEIPIGTVKNRIHHARIVMRELLSQ